MLAADLLTPWLAPGRAESAQAPSALLLAHTATGRLGPRRYLVIE
ncbi:MAG TPA: hypothetical protein VJN44_08930 [Roseateles sp.]|nr:hypothetical protein [Roseateles sp.]